MSDQIAKEARNKLEMAECRQYCLETLAQEKGIVKVESQREMWAGIFEPFFQQCFKPGVSKRQIYEDTLRLAYQEDVQ